jgi:hypothetical protein
MQGAQTGMQGQQAGLAGLSQAGQSLGLGMQGAGLGLQGTGQRLAAGQLGLQGTAQGMQGAQAGLQGVGQQIAGGQLGLQGANTAIQGQQAWLQGVGQAVCAGQFGLQGASTAGQAAGTLGQLGQTQFGQESGINQALSSAGAQQQASQQQGLDVGYQNFLAEQQYPYQNLAFMQSMYNPTATPIQTMTSAYQQAPSAISQAAGLGQAGMGLYGASKMFKQGGAVGQGIDVLALHNVLKR